MKHFLQGKPSLDSQSLRPVKPSPNSIARAVKPSENTQHQQQHIDVVKEGDKVTRIIVTCGCGEVVEIDCLYPAGQ